MRTKLSVVVENALRLLLSQSATAQPSTFGLHTVKGRLLDPNRNLDRISELIASEDEADYAGRR